MKCFIFFGGYLANLFFITCLIAASASATAQASYTGKPPVPQTGDAALSEQDLKARYQNCPLGNYAGHRPGKVRYAKDRYIWVVTPAFAKTYCMPPEFVSEELKGAEAVAFKLVPGGFGENCGFGGKAEVCSQGVDLRFEIYISRDVKLPVKNEVDFTAPSRAHRFDSYSLIGHSALVQKLGRERFQANPAAWTLDRYEANAFGLAGIQGDKVVWPITTLYLDEYRGKLYDGNIDFIALQGSTGNFKNSRRAKLNVKDFVIVMRGLGDRESSSDRPLTDFAHVIRLPNAMSDQIQAMDKARGDDWEALGKRAVMPQSNSKPTLAAPK